MKELVPLAKPQKITYQSILGFPERTELIKGDLLWSNEEKKSVILGVLTNVGLDYFISVLPEESLRQLRDIIDSTR